MVMMTYKIPDSISQIALQGEFNEFDLNVFFQAEGKGKDAKFIYKNEVQKWLDLIRGSFLPSNIDDLKLGQDKRPPMPYSDARLLNILTHTLWFLPNVSSCDAMENLLNERQNTFYHDYKIINCSGAKAGIGLDALKPVRLGMDDPLKTKTITLSCGKLTTGVTVKPWTGVFMLRNLKSPESYFQTAFRAQSPWEITNLSYTGINKHVNDETIGGWDTEIRKQEYEIMLYNQQESMKENENPFDKIIEINNNNIEYPVEKDAENKKESEVIEDDGIYNNTIDEQLEKISSVKIGTLVIHKKFGKGRVIWIDKKRTHIKVNFGEGDKQFLFPDSIMKGHLNII